LISGCKFDSDTFSATEGSGDELKLEICRCGSDDRLTPTVADADADADDDDDDDDDDDEDEDEVVENNVSDGDGDCEAANEAAAAAAATAAAEPAVKDDARIDFMGLMFCTAGLNSTISSLDA
jgi:hypothetical protein